MDVLLGQGKTIDEVARQIGVTEQTYYRWCKEYGGPKIDQAKRLKELTVQYLRYGYLTLYGLLVT